MAEDFKRRDGMRKQKIAILTWHYYPNFGSALQAYALQEQLKALGYSVRILDYRNARYGKVSSVKNRIKALLAHAAPGRFSYPFLSFQEDCLDLTRTTQNAADLPLMAKHFDAVVCGSDQIWAPNIQLGLHVEFCAGQHEEDLLCFQHRSECYSGRAGSLLSNTAAPVPGSIGSGKGGRRSFGRKVRHPRRGHAGPDPAAFG